MLMVRLFHKWKCVALLDIVPYGFVLAGTSLQATSSKWPSNSRRTGHTQRTSLTSSSLSIGPCPWKPSQISALGHPKLGNRNCQLPKAFAIAPQSQHLTILQPQNQQTKKTTPHHPSTTKSANQESNPYSQNGGGTNLLCILIVKHAVAVGIMWQVARHVGNVIVSLPEAITIITSDCRVMCTSRTPVFTRLKTIKNCIHPWLAARSHRFLSYPSFSPTPQYSPQYAKSKIL